jgi:hypothetical protein
MTRLRNVVSYVKSKLPALAEGAKQYEELLKIAFVLVTAAWALNEYYSKQEDARTERTIDYVKRFSTGELSSTELKLTQYWADPETLKRLQALPEGDKKKFAEFVVDAVEKSLKPEVWREYIFYNSMATCVSGQLCDPITACNMFKGELRTFVFNYGPYFEHHSASYGYKPLAAIEYLLAHEACAVAEQYQRGWFPTITRWWKQLCALCGRDKAG